MHDFVAMNPLYKVRNFGDLFSIFQIFALSLRLPINGAACMKLDFLRPWLEESGQWLENVD